MRLVDAEKLSEQVLSASYWDNQDEDVIWQLVQDAPTVDAVVLPCKLGDTLYDIYEAVNNGGDEIKEYKVSSIQINITKNGRAFLVVANTQFPLDDFGKTVFLTRKEAEAALAGRMNDNG